jgi:hypothetical protein
MSWSLWFLKLNEVTDSDPFLTNKGTFFQFICKLEVRGRSCMFRAIVFFFSKAGDEVTEAGPPVLSSVPYRHCLSFWVGQRSFPSTVIVPLSVLL